MFVKKGGIRNSEIIEGLYHGMAFRVIYLFIFFSLILFFFFYLFIFCV